MTWERFSAAADNILSMRVPPTPNSSYAHEQCDWWDKVFPVANALF